MLRSSVILDVDSCLSFEEFVGSHAKKRTQTYSSHLRRVSIGPLEIATGGARLQRKQEITPIPSGKNRRGISRGALEIASGVRSQRGKQEVTPIQPVKNRRGINLGPSEIIAGTRSQQRGNQELTPIQSTQNSWRQSCFYKLQEVDEGNILKEKGGEHAYIDVVDKNTKKGEVRVVIELNFRAEFEMARASKEYNQLVDMLPEVFCWKGGKVTYFNQDHVFCYKNMHEGEEDAHGSMEEA
ncbi:hypothetical protein IFM89_022120 [Coptis chinensis]|uniref:Uncharacterized protein n=1 Tax=Coptis chinensis TaxID=261450 RepID=A0A835HJ61_9MAGN|nr:hypothetical protein IFM89_022120 [Coptis chinensis]